MILWDSAGSSSDEMQMDEKWVFSSSGEKPWNASSVVESSPSFRISFQKFLLSLRVLLILLCMKARLTISVRSSTSNTCSKNLSKIDRHPVLPNFLWRAFRFDLNNPISVSTHGVFDFLAWKVFSEARCFYYTDSNESLYSNHCYLLTDFSRNNFFSDWSTLTIFLPQETSTKNYCLVLKNAS